MAMVCNELEDMEEISAHCNIGFLSLSCALSIVDIFWKEQITRNSFSDELIDIDYLSTIHNCRHFVELFGITTFKAKEVHIPEFREIQKKTLNTLIGMSSEELTELETGIAHILCNPVKNKKYLIHEYNDTLGD